MSSSEIVLAIRTTEDWNNSILKSSLPVAVEFYSSTCPYCAIVTPIFRKLAAEYRDRMVFAMMNAIENRDIAEGYGIMGVPTIKFLCNGRSIYEIVGLRSEEGFRADIDKVLQTHRSCISQSSPLYV